MLDENSSAEFLRSLFDVAVAVADPMQTIPKYLPEKPAGRMVVVGAGKASARMAEAVESVWGPCDGLVLTRYGYARPTQCIEIVEAAHPVPDQAGLDATRRLLKLVDNLGPDDFVLSLISGGGSALFCAPVEGIDLADLQAVNRELLKSGAPIGQMNTIRKHLSRITGGQLAAQAYPATMLSLMISDVAGDNPADIASGATVGEDTTPKEALDIVETYKMSLPNSVIKVLKLGSHIVPTGDPRLANVTNKIISAPKMSLEAACKRARVHEIDCRILGEAIEGEAREEAARQVKLACEIQDTLAHDDRPVLLLSGGECTVTGWGGGSGGPNAEFALAAAIALNARGRIYLIACDTDGVDGAAEVAGAIVRPDTLERAKSLGLDPEAALKRNDSHTFFAALADQVVTGPTLTNVNDFRAILIYPAV